MMKLLFISGSAAKKSHTTTLLEYLADLARKSGAETNIWKLADRPLPTSQPHWHHDPEHVDDPTVRAFAQAIREADHIVIGSPLYHGSYSGILKNALDCLSGDDFKGKKIGLVSNASNMRKAHQACLHMTTVVQTMYGHPTQTQIGTHGGDYQEFDDHYQLVDSDIKQRCERLIEEVLS